MPRAAPAPAKIIRKSFSFGPASFGPASFASFARRSKASAAASRFATAAAASASASSILVGFEPASRAARRAARREAKPSSNRARALSKAHSSAFSSSPRASRAVSRDVPSSVANPDVRISSTDSAPFSPRVASVATTRPSAPSPARRERDARTTPPPPSLLPYASRTPPALKWKPPAPFPFLFVKRPIRFRPISRAAAPACSRTPPPWSARRRR